ncbi:MAG: phage shock protein operon transcriptional activator [Pseudomonadota bacterium]|nr:phage shock protein operon transcriptional activator [Pseudomonadota bacterium]
MTDAPPPPELIGQAPAFLDALAHASAAAVLDRPLLILGERGSGKELLAARIHFLSRRWDGPFIKLNCAAMTDELLDSELFGHEAGAFTGAQKRHRGRFERADGGTLFLDEIASASLRVQEKLLRVIEYGEYERIGGEQTLTADVRIVAAANVDLKARAVTGRFRADLLDRLAFDVVAAPPLRERKEDIPLLAAHFAAGLAREMEARYEGFTPEAMAAFARHDWPGNVRELKNAAERSLYRWLAAGNAGPVGEAAIDPFEEAPPPPEELHVEPKWAPEQPKNFAQASAPADLRKGLDNIERRWVEETLAGCGGNQRLAAERLSLTYDQMRGLVRKHNLAGRRGGG